MIGVSVSGNFFSTMFASEVFAVSLKTLRRERWGSSRHD